MGESPIVYLEFFLQGGSIKFCKSLALKRTMFIFNYCKALLFGYIVIWQFRKCQNENEALDECYQSLVTYLGNSIVARKSHDIKGLRILRVLQYLLTRNVNFCKC